GWYMGVQCSPFYITDGYDEYNSIDGSAHMWSWTYDSSSNQLIQTDPYGQQTVASYDSSGNVAQQDVYPGAWNNSFRMQRTTYSGGDYGRTTVTALCSPSDPSDGCGAGDSAALKSSSSIDLDDYGMVTSTSTTDWGVGSPPSTALRQTVYTYNVSGNGEVPASVKVEDGSGNVAAETTWGYSGGVNPASESAYTGASTALTTSFTWNTNGTLATVTAPNGGTTTNGYECGTGFFPDSVATPVGSTSANWDCDGGVETSATDLNGNGSSATYDARWRPLSTTNAEGDTTYFTYPSSTNSYRQLERSTTVGGSTDDVITVLDPLGRPSLQQRRQTPGGANFDSVETTYDFDGRPATVSMPYVALAGADEPAGTPVTTTTYDALSRPVKAVDGAGGETDFQYVQNDVLTMLLADGGQPTVLRQRQLDGLGRLASVCEITSGSGIGGNWPGGACGQTNNAGNGYLTAYARNALGEITSVAQNAQGGSKEPRAFQYDELGRLTQETNPETQEQPVTFTYDSDASCGTTGADAGALVKRVDARGIVTCYLHDAAKSGRLDHVTYNDGTPAKYFVYGRSSSETDEGFQVSNGVGRLVEAYTGSHATDEVFDYNKLGRITLAAEATPHSGGWYQTYANYFFNGVPDALLLENGAGSDLLPGEIFYGADGEGRPTTATYGSNALVTAASYSALGLGSETYASGDGHTDSDIYGYDPNTGRLGSYTFSVDGYSDVGRYQWLKNGELSTFSVSDSEPGAADNGFGCSYTHDDLGRLSGANCGASSDQTFTYDPFGNVCKTASAGTNFCPSYNLYNQVAAANYDKDGDETSDPVSGAADAYDAEGRPVTFLDTAVVYDALGRAVEAGGAEFIYGPSGGKIAVMDGQALTRADVPLAGGAEAVFTGAGFAYYRHADALGSARLATTYAGAFDSATAYAPYGEPLLEAGTHDRNFTGQKQDIANGSAAGSDPNGQYDFLQREYSPTQSRWWTPDPAGLAAVDPGNPQSWNRYAYALGDPVTLIDPDGLCPNGTHDATVAEMAAAIQTAETYVGHRVGHSSGSHWQPGPHPKIDCSGLVMCALAGARFGSGFPLSYLGLNLTTRSIDQWTDPGTGAVGDIIYFAHPGHVGIVTGPNTFIGSQTSTGPRSNVQFGPTAPYWGKPGVTSSPVFRRACVADQQHATSAGGGGGSPVGGGGGMPGQSPFGGVDQSDPPQISWVCAGLLGGPQHCSWHVYFNKR
ncbi:MAG: RHS repeat-associated core domain-containing protein, partial [Terriglobales bacterium]